MIGKADLVEEIARIYSYNNIPETRLADELPLQRNNLVLEQEERIKDLLVALGLQEVVTYRLTSPEREARILPQGAPVADLPYVRLINPSAPERAVMRRSLLASDLEILEKNARLRERLAFFEIGPIFLPRPGEQLPEEARRLVLVMTGERRASDWDLKSSGALDFYDLKGVLEGLLTALHINDTRFEPVQTESLHPGKSAALFVSDQQIGVFGELHPRVKQNYDFLSPPVMAAELDLDHLLAVIPQRYEINAVPVFPPVLEDIAVVVPEELPAEQVAALIRQTGGKLLAEVRLFDVFRGGQIGAGNKSLAYSLTYQAQDHTISAAESTALRNKIVKRLERELALSCAANPQSPTRR